MARAAGGDRDSRLNGARGIALNSSVNGRFPGRDLDDLVRFNTTQRSSFNLTLNVTTRRSNVDVELYRFVRPVADVLRSIGRTDFRRLRAQDRNANFQLVGASRNGGNQPDQIALDIEAGDYFVRFLKRSGRNPRYSATVNAEAIVIPTPGTPVPGTPVPGTPVPGTPVPGTPVPGTPTPGTPVPGTPTPGTPVPGTPTPGTPTPGTPVPPPIPVTNLTLGSTVTNRVNNNTAERRYRLNNLGRGDYLFNLSGLNADADFQVLSADGKTVISSATLPGNTTERKIVPLNQGNYLLRVFRKAGNVADTTFALRAEKLNDTIANTQAGATNLGTLGSSTTPRNVSRVNYAVTNGKNSPVDFLKFRVQSGGTVKIDLVGRPSDGDRLFGDLDIDLYSADQNPDAANANNRGISSRNFGNDSEVFKGRVSANTDYFLRIRPKNGVVTGSTYNLRVAFTPGGDQPTVVRDIAPGLAASNAANFTEVGGLAYFTAASTNAQGASTTGLWLSEGTINKTTKLADFAQSAQLSDFTKIGNTLYFAVKQNNTNAELWRSDGTVAGTRRVFDPQDGADVGQLAAVGNTLYFVTSRSQGTSTVNQRKLYRLNPGATTPQTLTNPLLEGADYDANFGNLTAFNGTLYFTAEDNENNDSDLWRVNGNNLERMLLRSNGSADPGNLTVAGDHLFLSAAVRVGSGPVTRELVRIDNFSAGAFNSGNFTVYNLNGTGPANPRNLTYVASTKTLYFTANDTGTGNELRKLQFTTNTSETVTPAIVSDIRTGIADSNPTGLFQIGNRIIFSAADSSGAALWISDGTEANTQRLSSLAGLSGLSNLSGFRNFTVVNGKLFFTATDSTNGEELRRIILSGDSGTLTTYDIRPGAESSSPSSLEAVGSQLFFVANNGTDGNEPWSILA